MKVQRAIGVRDKFPIPFRELYYLYYIYHRCRKLLKAGGAQEVVINFELFARAKLLCGRGRHVKVGGAQAPSAPRFLRLCI